MGTVIPHPQGVTGVTFTGRTTGIAVIFIGSTTGTGVIFTGSTNGTGVIFNGVDVTSIGVDVTGTGVTCISRMLKKVHKELFLQVCVA